MNRLFVSFIFILISFKILADEIEILLDIPGEGPKIKSHDKIEVNYIGTFEDGTEFDSSYSRKKPLEFQIGLRQVIPGWELGIMGMKAEGKRIIKIPSSLAYGKKGVGDLIPPNSTLIFEIEILNIKPPRYKIINIENFISLQKDLVAIDIRTQGQKDETGIIDGSHQIAAFDIYGNLNHNFIKRFHAIVMEDEQVVFISDKGEISSILANGFAENLGVKNVYSLKGGMQAWVNQNNKVINKIILRHHQL